MLLIINTFRVSDYIKIQNGKEVFTSPTYFLFLLLIFYLFLVIFIKIVIARLKKKYTEKLDNIEETGIKSEVQFFRLLRFGFELNHPKCYDWSLFHIGLNSLKSKRIMICFAKISAYYFNKEDHLISILNYFKENLWDEVFIKNISFQIHSLIQSHEVSLNKNLKKELVKLQRKCLRCRSLMRYIWQSVICNDLSHIDRLALLLYTHTKNIEESYAHILLNFSHNNFVAKSYAYFLSDVMQKQAESKYWISVEKTLRSGRKIVNERSQIISKSVMGKYLKDADYYITDKIKDEKSLDDIMERLEELVIPKYKYVGQPSRLDSMNPSQQNDIGQMEEFSKDDDERKKSQLELLINNVRLPSMKCMAVITFISFSLIIPFLIIIPFIISNNHASISQTAFLSMIQSGCLAPAFIQTLIIGFLTVLSSTDMLSPLITNFQVLNIPSELWPNGWTNETTNKMIHVLSANELRKRVNDFNNLISQVSLQKYYYDSIVAPFYSDQFDYSVYDVKRGVNGNSVPILIQKMNLSIENILALYVSLSYRITRFHESDKWFYGKSQDFMNIEANSDTITSNLNEYTSIIIDLALNDRKSHSNLLTSILSITTVLIVVVSIITWIFVTYFIERDSNKIYSIFQFVPKNEISVVMHNLSPKEEEEGNLDDKESGLKNNALRTLITPVGKYKNNWFSIVKVVVTLLIIIIACLNLSIQVYLKNVLIDVPFSAAPLIFHCGKIHTQVGTILHKILLYLSYFMMIEVNQTGLLEEINVIMSEILPNLDEFRFGGESNKFYKGINSIDSFFGDRFSQRLCDWPLDHFYHANLFFCENYETSLAFMLNYIRVLMESSPALDYESTYLCPIICWFFKTSYEQFVMPTEDYLMEMFSEKVVFYKKDSAQTSIIIASVLFIIGVILTILIPRVAYPVYNCLRLLLFIDNKIVYSSKPIMKLLSNDFSKFKSSKSSSSNSFDGNFDKYYDFISSIDDSVLIASNEGVIVGANKSAIEFLSNSKKTCFFQDEKVGTNNESTQTQIGVENLNQSKKRKKIHKRKKYANNQNEFNIRNYLLNDNKEEQISSRNQMEENENHIDESFRDSIIGKSVIDVIQNRKFTRVFNITQNQGFQPSFEISLSNDDSIHLTSIAVLHTGEVAASKEFTINCIAFYCFVISDRIEKANLSKQLEEETNKCRRIISSFFPERMVNYIQTGQSDSYEITVPSATIVFIEMVQFSPFYFMSEKVQDDVNDNKNLAKLTKLNVLSRFISELDRIIERHQKMIRVKTLGGCYMAAGGIFDSQITFASSPISSLQQINQIASGRAGSNNNISSNNINAAATTNAVDAVQKAQGAQKAATPQHFARRSTNSHAIDAVSFALDAINAVQMIAMELNMPLKIRAGCHTCGPLSAGIAGDDQPTLEVVGTGISTALAMKETATEMTVHITDAVCNLVLSGGFKIREADDVLIDEKSVKTFVVTDYANK